MTGVSSSTTPGPVKRYITTASGMRGFYAVPVEDDNGFHAPVMTGIGSYPTNEGAQEEAREWAAAVRVEFQP